jgi:hypothetical protein
MRSAVTKKEYVLKSSQNKKGRKFKKNTIFGAARKNFGFRYLLSKEKPSQKRQIAIIHLTFLSKRFSLKKIKDPTMKVIKIFAFNV